MKIISLLVFIVALIGSWFLAHREQSVPESVHMALQADFKRIIAEYISKNRPNAKNLVFKKFYTEAINAQRVKAVFAYTFDDATEKSGPVAMDIEGYGILNHTPEKDPNTWTLDELRIMNNGVEFKEALKVTPKPDADEAQ